MTLAEPAFDPLALALAPPPAYPLPEPGSCGPPACPPVLAVTFTALFPSAVPIALAVPLPPNPFSTTIAGFVMALAATALFVPLVAAIAVADAAPPVAPSPPLCPVALAFAVAGPALFVALAYDVAAPPLALS